MLSVSTQNVTDTIFLKELGFTQNHPTVIHMDSLPFLNLIVGDKGASVKSKHILICLSIINEAYANGDIDLKHMSTKHIPSCMLKKLVPAPIRQYLRTFVDNQTTLDY